MILEHPSFIELLPSGTGSRATHQKEVLTDYWLSIVSREVSILARREVLTGKAKFGVTGDGKELAQIAMARSFRAGDYFAPYYRGQTFMFRRNLCSIQEYFSQLYADSPNDPFSSGRQMNNHYATAFIDDEGNRLALKDLDNVSACLSSTAGSNARALGLALASKKFRETESLKSYDHLSDDGNEICFSTIGDASTSEGVFWETMNAACVLKVPLLTVVMDDGYGISVPVELQTTKSSISEALAGFELDDSGAGMIIRKVKGWDYAALCATMEEVSHIVRERHIPALIHVYELTQPQGHSTSGSHERYKSKDRLSWEKEYDCIIMMEQWMIQNEIVTEDQIEKYKKVAKEYVREERAKAWKKLRAPISENRKKAISIYEKFQETEAYTDVVRSMHQEVLDFVNPHMSEIVQNLRRLSIRIGDKLSMEYGLMSLIGDTVKIKYDQLYTNLYSSGPKSALKVPVIAPAYSETSESIVGFKILNAFFKIAFEAFPNTFAFGEDVGMIGDVNQGFAGIQDQFGIERVFDCGIREWTIMGQAIGMAMRGLRPIAEIQYLDYIFYGLTPLVDDLATLRYRTNGLQSAPVIIRTRGHRLEGIWHTGSHMGAMLHSLRGVYLLTPRNMVQAAGMYRTMLQSDDPAIIVECLNGYRIKETLPDNIGEYTVPLGVPELITDGADVTVVTYGACVRVAEEALELLEIKGITIDLIDVQTLMPFDLEHSILESIKKTNKVLFLDEDVPGGASAYMMQQVLEIQGAYEYLDAKPICLTSREHRTPYGTDGDYFCKPNPEIIFYTIIDMLKESEPDRFS